MAAEFVTAMKTNEIPVGKLSAVDVGNKRIAVANVDGTFYAFDDACTHEQCSLTEMGELSGTTITCTPATGPNSTCARGKVLAPPAVLPVAIYPVPGRG